MKARKFLTYHPPDTELRICDLLAALSVLLLYLFLSQRVGDWALPVFMTGLVLSLFCSKNFLFSKPSPKVTKSEISAASADAMRTAMESLDRVLREMGETE